MLLRVHRTLKYVRHNVIAFTALFVALGGTAFAASGTVFSSDIVDGQVMTADLATGAVTAAKVKNYTLNAYDIQDNSLSSGRIYGLDGGDIDDDGLTGDDIDESTLTGVCFPSDPACAGPKGDQGDQGDTGDTGPKGDPCLATDPDCVGPKGNQGSQGDPGPTGDTGATGQIGPQGPQGETGPAGPKGGTGDTGATGPKGDTGATGPKGDTGSNNPDATLAPGKTLTGVYSMWGGSNGYVADSVNFRIPLAAGIDNAHAHVVFLSQGFAPVECPTPGQAQAGHLCLYVTNANNVIATNIFRPDNGQGGASPTGFSPYGPVGGSGVSFSHGSWAVTAPVE